MLTVALMVNVWVLIGVPVIVAGFVKVSALVADRVIAGIIVICDVSIIKVESIELGIMES